jgi:2,3-bisphosphoglycerate-dependent phosphoglycerate mutase
MNLYLIRHGEPAIPEGFIQDDFPLSEKGHRQAEALSEHLHSLPLDHLLASPLNRARQTADWVKRNRVLPLQVREGFQEMNLGEMAGLSRREVFQRYGDTLNARPYPLMEYGYVRGETAEQFHQRVVRTFEEHIWSPFAHTPARVALVAHGGVICAILMHFLGLIFDGYLTFMVDFTGVTHIDTRHGRPRIRSFNDLTHLREKGLL